MYGKYCNVPQIFTDDWMLGDEPDHVFECTKFVKDKNFDGLFTFMKEHHTVFSDELIAMVETIIATLSSI